MRGASAPKPADLEGRDMSLWRYKEALPLAGQAISLGETVTPLMKTRFRGSDYLFKLDYLLPTGSYKDRGVAVMISQIGSWGLSSVVEDSSGNAGASLAAYCARAGIAADVYIPSYTSEGKAAQIALYGANLVRIPGTREDTMAAAREAGKKSFYASHNWSPFFEHGIKTYLYEVWEQLGFELPDVLVVPCGFGSLVTSAYAAIQEILQADGGKASGPEEDNPVASAMAAAGLAADHPSAGGPGARGTAAGSATRVPRIVAVQSENCAPLFTAWSRGLGDAVAIQKKETVAEGIASANPIKGKDVIRAVHETGGCFVTVSDKEVWQAMQDMARTGIFIEPTSATAPAAASKLREQGWIKPDERVVIELTGSGLKAADKLAKMAAT